MPKPRRFLLLALLLASSVWLALGARLPAERRLPFPDVQAVVRSPLENNAPVAHYLLADPLLADYYTAEQLVRRGEPAALKVFVEGAAPSFLRYRTALALARSPRLPATQRAEFYEQLFATEFLEPFGRSDLRQAYLEYAEVAERAGLTQRAIEAYARAFPLAEAVMGIERLEPRARERARLFWQLGASTQALQTLQSIAAVDAPLLAARVYRSAGELEGSLGAYNRFLARTPAHLEAQTERAWVLLALERFDEATRAFGALPSPTRSYGLAAVAAQTGDAAEAAEHYLHYAEASGDPEGLWRATELLETLEAPARALPVYLELARQPSPYRADAAYRALVLAEALGDEAASRDAEALLPETSYFALLRHGPPDTPERSDLERVSPEVIALSDALLKAGDREAAVGELVFALAAAEDEATTIALAEALQSLGEFRRSAQAASQWVASGSRDRRTWEAAYPPAYLESVQRYAAQWGVEPALVWAVMRQESGFYPRAVSTSEAKGAMQIVPATWTWLAELLAEPAADPFEIAPNIRYGVFYLQRLLAEFEGDLERTVAAYNGGPGYISRIYSGARVAGDQNAFYRFIDRSETRTYLQSVMHNYEIYRSLYPSDDRVSLARRASAR